MIYIDTIIALQTYSEVEKLIFETEYLVEDYFTFQVSVLSTDFSGKAPFCLCKKNLNTFINELSYINSRLEGSARLDDYDSDGFIAFSMEELGRLVINGQIGGSHSDQYIKFKFTTDQTVISKFVNDLNSICKYQDLREK